jgi:hypothetical protein
VVAVVAVLAALAVAVAVAKPGQSHGYGHGHSWAVVSRPGQALQYLDIRFGAPGIGIWNRQKCIDRGKLKTCEYD